MKPNSRLLMCRILRLRWIQLDLYGFLGLVHIEDLSESLVALRDHLNSDLPLRDGRNLGQAFLVRPHLPSLADLFPEFQFGAAPHELHHYTSALHGAAAQGPDFVSAATVPVAQRCLNSGVPPAQQFAGATQYVTDYQNAFHTAPGTWGTFTYDSVKLLAQAVRDAGGWNESAVQSRLAHTVNYQGITGTITIEPNTGNRANSPVVVLNIDSSGNYLINPTWAQSVGFPLPATSAPTP